MWMVVGLIAVALGTVYCWHVMVVTPAALHLTVLEAPICGLPAMFDGFRIAVLTDFHHGPQQPIARARRAVRYVNSQAPDLAVLLGDFGTSERVAGGFARRSYESMFTALGPVLQGIRSRLGVVAVLGNHDYYADAEATVHWLRSIGIRVLRNEAFELPSADGPLRLVGLNDLVEGDVDQSRVTALLQDLTPTIVLSHHPDAAIYCASPSVRLMLSGHTHGGQVAFPWIGAPVTRSDVCRRRSPAGWIPNAFVPLFVSRGIGTQIPLRVGCPPEVVVLTLRATRA